jgi:hypothetical protein
MSSDGERGGILTTFTSGSTLLLGVLLLSAGMLKLTRPSAFAHAIHRLLPAGWRWRGRVAVVAAPVVAAVEVMLGVSLLVTTTYGLRGAHASVVATGVVCSMFVVVVAYAKRVGARCGCFGSFSDGPAGRPELGRSVALAGLALGTLTLSGHHPPRPFSLAAVLVVGALIGLVLLVAVVFGVKRSNPNRPMVRATIATLFGAVHSRFAHVALPTNRTRRPREPGRLVAQARATSTVRAMEAWLVERGARVDWDDTVVRSVAVNAPGVGSTDCLVMSTIERDGLALTVSVGWNGHDVTSDAVVFGKWRGLPIGAAAGQVLERLAVHHAERVR